jgi:hypothetical protein
MLPHHVVRYVVVAAAIYITAAYLLALRPSDAFTLAGVAIASLYVADHYAYYSWMKRQLYGNNLFYNDTAPDPFVGQQYAVNMQPQIPCQTQPQYDNYGASPAEIRQDPRQRNVAQLYQFRDTCM